MHSRRSSYYFHTIKFADGYHSYSSKKQLHKGTQFCVRYNIHDPDIFTDKCNADNIVALLIAEQNWKILICTITVIILASYNTFKTIRKFKFKPPAS